MVEFKYVEEELPEQLPEGGSFQFPAEVKVFGFIPTPSWRKDQMAQWGQAEYPQRMFVYGLDPLSFQLDTNPEWFQYERQGNLRMFYVDYLNNRGELKGPNSQMGDIKAAFEALGYPLRTGDDCRKLIGKKFLFQSLRKKYSEQQTKDTWFDIPVEELAADYTFQGERPIRKRGYENRRPQGGPQVRQNGQAQDQLKKLAQALDGKAPAEFVREISKIGMGSFVTEAAVNHGQGLIEKLTNAGLMRFEDGRLVKA